MAKNPIQFSELEPEDKAAEPAPEPISPHDRLRAFEDKHIGVHTTRIDGKIQKGHGSTYQSLVSGHKVHHAALEALIAAHEAHAAAERAVVVAAEKLAAAQRRADETEPTED